MAEHQHEQTRDKVARGVEVGGTAVATGVGSALGYTRLRDAYREDYPGHFERGAKKAQTAARKVTPRAGKFTRTLSHGKVGFAPLAAGTLAGVSAASANRYRKHRKAELLAEASMVSKSAFGVELSGDPLAPTRKVDAKVRKLRRKAVPSVTYLAAEAGDRTRSFIAEEQAKFAKSFDQERSERRRQRTASTVLGLGAGAATVESLRATRQGRGHLQAANHAHALRDRSFKTTATDLGPHAEALDALAHAKRTQRGKGVTAQRLADSATTAHNMRNNFTAGYVKHYQALHSEQAARAAFGRARTMGVAGVGLGAGAYIAHRRASSHDRA